MSNLLELQADGGISFLLLAIVSVLFVVLIAVIIIQAYTIKRIKSQINISKNQFMINQSNTVEENGIKVESIVSSQKLINDEEIVAAITAALCVYANMSDADFRIKSIKRVSGIDSAWRRSGII